MQAEDEKGKGKGWSFATHLAFKKLNSKDAQTLLLQLADCKITVADFRLQTYRTVVKYIVIKQIIDWAHQNGALGIDAKKKVTEDDFYVSNSLKHFLVFESKCMF